MSATPERRVFAVACGADKVEPIIAAVRGQLVNGLITDELTALEILQDLERLGEEVSSSAEEPTLETTLGTAKS
jgi:hypothetical protein